MPKIQEGKIQAISTMRVLAMLMIITYHSMLFYTGKWQLYKEPIVPLWKIISHILDAIDLPMFVFISGFLFGHLYIHKKKYCDKKAFIMGKAKRLFIPYIIWGIFLVLSLPNLYTWSDLFSGISHLWFLLMLFVIFVISIIIAPLICTKSSGIQDACIFIGACILFYLFYTHCPYRYVLCTFAVLYYFPAFIFGIFCAKYNVHSLLSTRMTVLILLIALVILAFAIIKVKLLTFMEYYLLLMPSSCFIIISTLSLLHKTVYYGSFITIITHFDKLSLGIYIFNQIVIDIFLLIPGMVPFLKEHYYIGVPIIFLVGLIIPWFLSMLFNKFKFLKWTIG